MPAVLQVQPLLAGQLQVGLVNQARRIQGLPSCRAPQVASGEHPHLVVDERYEAIESVTIAFLVGAQELCDFACIH